MQIIKLTLLAVLGLMLNSCTLSLHPLFTGSDRIADQTLAGVWRNEQHQVTFTLHWIADDKFYLLDTEMKEQPHGEFNAILGTVGKHRFLQIAPRRPDNIHAKSFFGGHFLHAFSFWKVDPDKDKLILKPLNYEWIAAKVQKKELEIKHEWQKGGFIILTASSEELKAFILKYADDKDAFSGELSFERKK